MMQILADRVNFFIKDLVYQCYFYAVNDKRLAEKNILEVNRLTKKVAKRIGAIEYEFSFLNEEQNDIFFTLLNQLLGIRTTIASDSHTQLLEQLQSINLKDLVSNAKTPFDEFNVN